MNDRLAGLLQHYALRAQVFHSGSLCGSKLFGGECGYLHVLRSGSLEVRSPLHAPMHLDRPSLLFYPRAAEHRFVAAQQAPADLVCARVELGASSGNPLALALPPVTLFELGALPQLAQLLALLFEEAGQDHCARQAAIDRLCELVLIHLLRLLMDRGATSAGLLAGLADPRLARALSAMHDAPAEPWTLASLAGRAGMSRARFAAAFREVVGCTPGDYLAQWRINVACSLLRRGLSVGRIADQVGYASAQALARAFRARLDCSPSAWLARQAA